MDTGLGGHYTGDMKKVVVYTTPACVYCQMVKAFLIKKGIKYEEKNVATDTKAREEMIKASGQMGVPVVVVGKDIVVGFDKGTLEHLLGQPE